MIAKRVKLLARALGAMACLVLVAGLLGCSAEARTAEDFRRTEAPSEGRIEVTFWHAMGGGQARSLNAIIDEFNALPDNPYYVVSTYQGRYNELQQKLIASLYAGQQPACSQMYESWVTRFLKFQCLQPVEAFIEVDPEFTREDVDDLIDSFRVDSSYPLTKTEDGYRLDYQNGETTLVTLPFNKSVYVLFVNDTLLKELGYEGPPETWDEMLEVARRMTKRDEDGNIERYGFAVRPFIEAFTPLLMSAGGNYMDHDMNEFTFANEEGQAALEFLRQLALGEDDGRIGYVESNYLNSPFGAGIIGMYISSTASFPFNDMAVGNKFIWRAYPMPSRDADTDGRVLAQGTNVGIFRQGYTEQSRLPDEVQLGAWEFMKFLASKEKTAQWARETGYMPVRKSAAELPEMRAYMEENPNFANAFSSLERAEFEPAPIWWDNVRTIFQREVSAMLNQRKTAEEALESALAKAETIRASAGKN
ncbi:MAG: ABC transporter substrate-binding protein [Sumerlaeia bacterium]